MNNRVNQIYEDYWSYTAAWTDIHGTGFIGCLQVCVDFIDKHSITSYEKEIYSKLQSKVKTGIGISDASVRKGINQMVKLGFLKPYLQGYRSEAKEFLDAKTNKRRQSILSKVVYNYSNFQNSMTQPDANSANQMKFLLKTLEEVGSIDKRALIALMTTNINDYPDGYLTKQELDDLYIAADDINFIDRKYNQLGHFKSLLGNLDDLCNHDGVIYFKTDAERLFGEEYTNKKVRDPYLQRVYKSELEEESCIHFECDMAKCMLEGLHYPVLIASHIKPYSHCKEGAKEQFDINNGLLLSKNTDLLFDLGYMTISDNGEIIPSKKLDSDVKNYLSHFRLHKDFINSKRMAYMKYHRENVFEKRFNSRKERRYILD